MKHFVRNILYFCRETPLRTYAWGYILLSTYVLSCRNESWHGYLLCLKCSYNSLAAFQKQVFEIRKPMVNTVKREEPFKIITKLLAQDTQLLWGTIYDRLMTSNLCKNSQQKTGNHRQWQYTLKYHCGAISKYAIIKHLMWIMN